MLKILTMFYLYGMAGSFFRRFTKRFFVFCNVAVAVVFLLGCYSAWFNPAHFWFVGFFTLASLYLLLLLIVFIVFWVFAKRKLMLISIIAIALAWKPIGHIFRLKPSKDFELAKQANGIRVMTWNVEHFDILEHKTHPERKTEMLDMINKYKPDIACFQEMVGGDKDSTAINYVPIMAKQIHFENYFYAYSKLDDFDGKHHFGIITFSKYPIINKQIISVNPRSYNNTFQYIDILKQTDTFRIFNLHLQSLKFSTDNLQFIKNAETTPEIDIEQSKNIIAKFKTGFIKRKTQSDNIRKSISESPYPVIVCGDFNDVPNSYAYCTIGKGLRNTFVEKGSGISRTFSGISPTLRIDNIFVDKRFEVEQYTRIAKKLSDHFPVITDVRLAD
jgi:endonuclease/exonuclease/phosphatase family metal-dependent hydrolase